MSLPYWTALSQSRTPRGAPARVALHAGAVAHQREVAAFAAGFALVALGAGFGAFLGCGLLGVSLGVGPVERVELLRGRELRLRLDLQRGRAGGVECGDVRGASRHPLTPALSHKGRGSRRTGADRRQLVGTAPRQTFGE